MLRNVFARSPRAARATLAVIDAPAIADVVDRFAFPVVGWVWMGEDHPRIAAVEVWSGATLLGETSSLAYRPDVCAAVGLPDSCRTGFTAIAGYPQAARGSVLDLAIRVRFFDGSRTGELCRKSARSIGFDDSGGPLDILADDDVRRRPTAAGALALPPDALQLRQTGGVWGDGFYREGRVMLNQIGGAFAAAGRPLATAEAILDFGCGCGRVLGGFVDLPHAGEVWGCDIDPEAIAWDQAHLRSIGQFIMNAPMPPTPFATGQFDAIYSVSVFTHLPEEMQFAWLTELRRILRTGGILVASVHGGPYVFNSPAEVRAEVAARGFAYRTGAITPGLPDFYMVAMHSESYIRAKWTRFFELVGVREAFIHRAHDAVVMRRTAD